MLTKNGQTLFDEHFVCPKLFYFHEKRCYKTFFRISCNKIKSTQHFVFLLIKKTSDNQIHQSKLLTPVFRPQLTMFFQRHAPHGWWWSTKMIENRVRKKWTNLLIFLRKFIRDYFIFSEGSCKENALSTGVSIKQGYFFMLFLSSNFFLTKNNFIKKLCKSCAPKC